MPKVCVFFRSLSSSSSCSASPPLFGGWVRVGRLQGLAGARRRRGAAVVAAVVAAGAAVAALSLLLLLLLLPFFLNSRISVVVTDLT